MVSLQHRCIWNTTDVRRWDMKDRTEALAWCICYVFASSRCCFETQVERATLYARALFCIHGQEKYCLLIHMFFWVGQKKCLCKPWFLCLTLFDVHTNTVGKYRWKLHLPTRVTEIHFFHFHAEPCFPNGSKCSRVCNSLFNACFPNYIHQTKRHIQLHLIFFHPQAGFNIIGCNPAKQCKAIIGHKSSPS